MDLTKKISQLKDCNILEFLPLWEYMKVHRIRLSLFWSVKVALANNHHTQCWWQMFSCYKPACVPHRLAQQRQSSITFSPPCPQVSVQHCGCENWQASSNLDTACLCLLPCVAQGIWPLWASTFLIHEVELPKQSCRIAEEPTETACYISFYEGHWAKALGIF